MAVVESAYRYPVLPQTILPYEKNRARDEDFDKSSTRYILDEAIKSPEWKNFSWHGFRLVGQGEPYATCGKWGVKGCLNSHLHNGQGNYFEPYQKFCGRPSCSSCIEAWSNQEANRATKRHARRIEVLGGKASHVIFSPPDSMIGEDYKKIESEFRKIAKRVGVTGNCEVFHPARFDGKKMIPIPSPHFHGVSYGWFSGEEISKINKESGWVVKKIRTLQNEGDIFALIKYLLSHAGLHQRLITLKSGKKSMRTQHTVKWTGDVSYRKLKVEKEAKEPKNCPGCNEELVRLVLKEGFLVFQTIPPPNNFVGFSHFNGFELVKTFDKTTYYNENWTKVRLEESDEIEAKLEASVTGKKTSYFCQRLESFN